MKLRSNKLSILPHAWLCLGMVCGLLYPAGAKGPAKEYAIRSAQVTKQAYQYCQFACLLRDTKSVTINVKSALTSINAAISAMDSAIYFAKKDSCSLVGLDYAYLSKQYNREARAVLKKAAEIHNPDRRALYFKKAVVLCGNAVVDAYTASLYFESGEAVPSNNALANVEKGKPLSKLEVDKALFQVLSDDLKRQESKILKEIEDLKLKLASTADPVERAKIEKQISDLETKLAGVQARRAEIEKKYANIVDLIRKEKGEVTATAIVDTPPPADPRPKTPETLTFETSNDAWGESIILDQPMPPGLFYKVQIGVYKTKIDPNVFQGITPITGETTPNGVKYAAGMFTKFNDAREAKDYIKGLGYTDAFVAAYYNGVKISIAEAGKYEKK